MSLNNRCQRRSVSRFAILPYDPPQPMRKSIADTFAALRQTRSIALLPFIPAGFPDLQTTAAILPALQAGGASLIEIGFPFSDPIADGPIIQAAFTQALAKKIKVADILQTVASARANLSIPIVAMVSYSIVYRYGPHRFFTDLSTHGFDAVIIPDLPPPEAQPVCKLIRSAGLDTVLLVSPTTPPDRRREITSLCSGFVYYLSVTGTTGERTALPADLEANIRDLKSITQVPVCVGFGVSTPQHVKQLAPVADGAIVGSAYVRKLTQASDTSPIALAQLAQNYTRELLSQLG